MSKAFSFSTETIDESGDRATPVTLYANLRQIFPETLLLECIEYHSPQTARSYICADPILKFSVKNNVAAIENKNRKVKEIELNETENLVSVFNDFLKSVNVSNSNKSATESLGLFGYVGYNAIPLFEDIEFQRKPSANEEIPEFQFALYRYVFRFDHFQNQMTALRFCENEEAENQNFSLRELIEKITFRRVPEYPFAVVGDETAEASDEEFQKAIEVCKKHIRRGDVFQIVPSRKFAQKFRGDEFQVYRALRRINPSPFLFFFDYGNFSLFGSSPEAQLLIRNRTATIHPIAGTYPRGADEIEDAEFAEKLIQDPKENAEHTMLVDLARNDLSRHCEKVRVEAFKKIEFYSHVIHLVSRVSGSLKENASAIQILSDTFPAGTLSGAPKYRAMQIINGLEPSGRSFYGGSVGFFGFGGECTQAIMIRSFLAKKRNLIFQAGAGIVADSDPEKETLEVENKLSALRRAVEAAENFNH